MDEAVRLRAVRVEPRGSGGRAYTVTVEVEVEAQTSFEAAQWLLAAVEGA